MGWSCSRSLGPARGERHPTQTPATPLCPGREAGCGNAETRRGGISLEDLPEKCHAGSDEERNLDRAREREGEGRKLDLSQLKRSLSVSFWFCRMLTDDGPVAE